jgi:hypothetical protein
LKQIFLNDFFSPYRRMQAVSLAREKKLMKKNKNLFFRLSIYRSYLLKRGHHLHHFCEEGKFGREMKFELSGFQKYLEFLQF